MSAGHVAALSMEIHVGASGSLKAKRAVVKHLVETARRRFGVSASEVGNQDRWQASTIGFAVVAPSPERAEELLDAVERFVWSHPELSVISARRGWLELDEQE